MHIMPDTERNASKSEKKVIDSGSLPPDKERRLCAAGIKRDIILIGALIATGLLIVLAVWLFSGKGQIVEVRVDGRVTARYSLSQDMTVRLNGEGGSNLLVISGGEAFVQDADCPDKLCVKTGRISRQGQSVICLPHRLVVEIKGDAPVKTDDIDVFVK